MCIKFTTPKASKEDEYAKPPTITKPKGIIKKPKNYTSGALGVEADSLSSFASEAAIEDFWPTFFTSLSNGTLSPRLL